MAKSSFISRRVSEFVGVALFALALIWLISLASYSPSDPVWFFNTGSRLPPANFAGRIGAFMPSVLAEISFVTHRQEGQLLKGSAYRQQIAEALFDAVVKYQDSLKKPRVGVVGMGQKE